MKFISPINFCFSVLFLLFGCQNEEHPMVDDDTENQELLDILNGELLMPSGELAMVYIFLLNSSDYRSVQHRYYDEDLNTVLTVNLNHEKDTLGASIYFYDHLGRLEIKKSYGYNQGSFSWTGDLRSTFNAEGTIETVHLILADGSPPRFRLRNVFDERGLLQVTAYSDEERYEYIYEDNLPVRKNYMIGESIYLEYIYRYNDQVQLQAKQTAMHGGGDAFQYFYDEEGRLKEERENSPQWGYSILSRKTYEYY